MKSSLLPISLICLSATLSGINTSSAALVAYFVDGTDADGAALSDLANNSGVDVTTLSAIGFQGGTSVTRPSFGTANTTPVGPTAGSSAGSEWLFMRSNDNTATGSTNPNALTDYFGFTVTAAGTNTLNLNSLKFDYAAVTNDGAGSSITGLAQAFINIDGAGFNPVGVEYSATDTNGPTGADGFGPVTSANIDLTSITGANSVVIRIGIADNVNNDGRATFLQGIQLDANIVAAVPEPSSTALLGLGALALILRRRK